MTQPARRQSVLRFDSFEVDLRAGELRRNGIRVRLQEKSFQLLSALLERPSEVLTQEDLEARLWPDVEVDVAGSLGEHVHRLRRALDDSAHHPRYIETVPKRGYRFIGLLAPVSQSTQEAEAPKYRRNRVAALLLSGAVLGAFGAALMYQGAGRDQGEAGTVRRFHLRPEDPVRSPGNIPRKSLAVSPDGTHIAWVGSSGSLWIQDLEEEQPTEVGQRNVRALFWSPDSEYLLFSARRGLLKVPVGGGPAAVLCDPVGVIWAGAVTPDRNTVVFAVGALPSLWEVPFDGGEPRPALSDAEREEIFDAHFGGAQVSLGLFPTFLPPEAGKRVVIFGIGRPNTPAYRLLVFDMDSREHSLLQAGAEPVYARSGHLLYLTGVDPVDLWAVPFSLRTRQVDGEPFLVRRGAWSHSAARDGTLVYADWEANPNELVWRDRSGRKLGTIGHGDEPRISPEGERVAYTLHKDIWIYNVAQMAHRRLTTNHAGDLRPIWSPDGKSLVFSSPRAGNEDIWQISIERAGGEPTLLYDSPEPKMPDHWSPDARTIAYHGSVEPSRWYLGLLTQEKQGGEWKQQVFSDTVGNAMMLAFHPSGRYVAYQSYVSGGGNAEIYVERFPEGGEQVPISTNRGIQARWSADGKKLFFFAGYRDAKREVRDPGLYVVSVITGPSFSASQPERLFSTSKPANYDVMPDGQSFIIAEPPTEQPELGIHVVQNWYEEFREQREGAQ